MKSNRLGTELQAFFHVQGKKRNVNREAHAAQTGHQIDLPDRGGFKILNGGADLGFGCIRISSDAPIKVQRKMRTKFYQENFSVCTECGNKIDWDKELKKQEKKNKK